MRKALIKDNKVVDVCDLDFPVHEDLFWVDCPDECVAGLWRYENNEFVLPPEPTYYELRQLEYPSIEDQLDTLYHGGYDAWKAQVQAVKDKYPKA